MSVEISCPSGLRYSARPLRVLELKALARANEANDIDGGLPALLGSTFEELIDAGEAYPWLTAGTRPSWEKILDGDATAALVKLRIASMGTDAEFRQACENCGRQMKESMAYSLADWDEVPYPQETLRVTAEGGTFSFTTPHGEEIRYRPPLLGQHRQLVAAKKRRQKRLQQARDPHWQKAMRADQTDFLVCQVTHVASLGDKSRDALAVLEWAEQLELGEFYAIREDVHARTGGIETKVSWTCQSCEWEQTRDVPLAGDFFLPGLKPRTTKAELEPEMG